MSETGRGRADGHALDGARAVAVSPDGKNVYATSPSTHAVVRLNRSTTTGAITQPAGAAGCVSETGAGPCGDGHALDGPGGVAVSPDGKNVYIASAYSDAVVRLDRNTTTGAITQPAGSAGCISQTGAGPCTDGHALGPPGSLAVSPDGRASTSPRPAVTWFGEQGRGAPQPQTSRSDHPARRDGRLRSEFGGACADGYGLDEPHGVAVSPDGRNVYVTVASTAMPWSLSTAARPTGRSPSRPGPPAASARRARDRASTATRSMGLSGVAVSPNGKSVYVTSDESRAVVRLNRVP